jgi:hypothetical protein
MRSSTSSTRTSPTWKSEQREEITFEGWLEEMISWGRFYEEENEDAMTLNRHQPQRLRSLRLGGTRFAGKSDAHDSASTLQQLDVTPATVALTQAFTCPHNAEAARWWSAMMATFSGKMPDWITG